ncbi:HlyD family efflux transporter periplasmic adaptor subunit [Azospirillum sp. B21]|uniref:HlyD family secretion protein n=1 Tax=Azospirillum sp. B21 TaxID=2607496 RepID=UPI0011ED8596|nr:HlyD family efflux transporter periplasmic adaptor subunit [Azospirillum sp. B21]KAA0582109.1 HlyD family efflux transporter periplasmic adaptor subunit [Azospirillum sp. B21]
MTIRRLLIALALLAILGAGAAYGWRAMQGNRLPAGFASGNGRIEANEIDVATKYAARVLTIPVQEGDLVEAGAVIATLDTRDLEAQLRSAEAQLRQTRRAREEAVALVDQRSSEADFAAKEMERALILFGKGHVAEQRVDQARNSRRTADAALEAAKSHLASADEAIAAAAGDVDRLTDLVADGVLKAPRKSRVLYRLAEPGEVLAAGGKAATLLDLSNVYMTFFLPTDTAGNLALGADARILLDAVPDTAIPATVTFVAPRAQFTPKQVETKSERDRMMFRVKARVPEALVTRYIERVKTGLTGMAYVKLDDKAAWPDWLESKLTREATSSPALSPSPPRGEGRGEGDAQHDFAGNAVPSNHASIVPQPTPRPPLTLTLSPGGRGDPSQGSRS